MSIAKNKKLWLGAGALGCFGMVMVGGFILVGGIALYVMSSTPAPAAPTRPPEAHGYAPENGGAPAPAPVSATVELAGQVVDAGTQQGIPGAYFLILMPGKTFADLQASGNPAQDGTLHSGAVSDGNGDFRVTGVERGYRYTVIAAADGYQPMHLDHGLEINDQDPEVTRLNPIPLSSQY